MSALTALSEALDELDIEPLHLQWTGTTPTKQPQVVTVWLRYRTDFEMACAAWSLKPHEKTAYRPDERHFWAERDNDDLGLLVQCASLPHHPDWQRRTEA
jgi:hypothetical protein